MQQNRTLWIGVAILIGALVIGQALAYVVAPASWAAFIGGLRVMIAQIAFWGPVCALFSAGIVIVVLRLLGFESLEEIRKESVEQNNPTPAIVFVGTLIASILFLTMLIQGT